MKVVSVFIFAVLLAFTASAQQLTPELKLQIPQLKKLDINAPFLIAPNAGAQTSFGEVYNLQPDNMPCLVPSTAVTTPMPVAITPLPERMPNPVPGFKLKPAPFKNRFMQQWKKNFGTTH